MTRFFVSLVAIFLVALGSPSSVYPGRDNGKDIGEIDRQGLQGVRWTEKELAILQSLWIASLPPLPRDPTNSFSHNLKAARLGEKFFFDPRFSRNGKIACASCHHTDLGLTDESTVARGIGKGTRRTMTLIGVAYNTWYFWDGRKDSLWAQALVPLENPAEQGISRTLCVSLLTRIYRSEYEELFGPLPDMDDDYPPHARPGPDYTPEGRAWDGIPEEKRAEINRVFVNMGKAIAAYVSLFLPGVSPFDRYAEAITNGDFDGARKTLTEDQIAGLKLFIGKGRCIDCHNGPLFTDGKFHNTGIYGLRGFSPDRGRAEGIRKVLVDEFNCRGTYSDGGPDDCDKLRNLSDTADDYTGAMKTPTLRNVAERPPYMHAGQLKTLLEVLNLHRNTMPEKFKAKKLGHGDLTSVEILQIEAFLKTLTGPLTIPHF